MNTEPSSKNDEKSSIEWVRCGFVGATSMDLVERVEDSNDASAEVGSLWMQKMRVGTILVDLM